MNFKLIVLYCTVIEAWMEIVCNCTESVTVPGVLVKP